MKRDIKKQAQTYTVYETNYDFMLEGETLENDGFRIKSKFKVKEGEPWYGIDVFVISIDMEDFEDFENIEDLDNNELDELIDNMDVQKFMNIVRDALGEEGVEMLYRDDDRRGFFTIVDEDYKATGHKGYNMSYVCNGEISFQAEIKYKFWIEDGIIEYEPIWEFENI